MDYPLCKSHYPYVLLMQESPSFQAHNNQYIYYIEICCLKCQHGKLLYGSKLGNRFHPTNVQVNLPFSNMLTLT